MKTDNEMFNKLMLVIEVALCALWLVCTGFVYSCWSLIWAIPLIRMWIAFLTYRKSDMIVCSITLFMILNLASFIGAYNRGGYELYLVPALKIADCLGHLFGWPLNETWHSMSKWETYSQLDSEFSVYACGILLTMFYPLVQYIFNAAKKLHKPSGMGKIKRWCFCLYLLVVIGLIGYIIPMEICISGSVAIMSVAIVLIPAVFFKGKTTGLMTRVEMTVLSVWAVFVFAYFLGEGYEYVTVFSTILFPIAFYVLVNWYYARKNIYKEIVLVTLGSVAFWFSQYMTDLYRVLLFALSVGLSAFAVFYFVRYTRKLVVGIMVLFIVALALPIISIGYNPYSAIHTYRLSRCKDYHHSCYGLMFVKSEKGIGIRDRYGLILPAEYKQITILDPQKPYFKVRNEDECWMIYDIERQKFATDEPMSEISPSGEPGIFRIKGPFREGILVLPSYYRKDGEYRTPEKLLILPGVNAHERYKNIIKNYYSEY